MEVARYVGDAAPNGKLFWRFRHASGPFALAGQRLYKARSTGRDRVIGEPGGHEADSLTA